MKNRILFVYSSFFGYEEEIIKGLERLNFEPIKFDERISNSTLVKAVYRLFPWIARQLNSFYFLPIALKLLNVKHISQFFILKGEVTPVWFVRWIHYRYPNVSSVLYTWDSVKNNPNCLNLKDFCSRTYSFDSNDCSKYGMILRPLFNVFIQSKPVEIDQFLASTVMSEHSDREQKLKVICDKLVSEFNVRTNSYIVSRLRSLDIFLRRDSFVKTKPLSIFETSIFIQNAKFVIDISHPDQSGLTMRSIEALALRKKLITTNKYIKNYVFYNDCNICVLDENLNGLSTNFIETEFLDYTDIISDGLSLDGWLNELIYGHNNNWLN